MSPTPYRAYGQAELQEKQNEIEDVLKTRLLDPDPATERKFSLINLTKKKQ